MKTILRILFSFLIVLNTLPVLGQNTSRISGSVFDEKLQEPVEQASVRVLNAKDSSYVNGAVTNASGNFQVQVSQGQYILNISYLGYASKHINVNANKDRVTIGKINMKEDAILLKEAIVTAKAVEIMVKGDTVEYNADSYKVQESAVLEDLMKKMPGVEIDSDGKITVNGKEIKKILVDGKEFFSDDPKIASKNLPASMINKLQVVDKKSDMAMMTGFDDGNEETVINLTIKPGMKEGAFGNAYAGYGSKDRYETNAMLSYMRDSHQLTVLGGTNNTNNAGFSDFASSSFGGMRPPRGLNFGNRNGVSTSTNGGINFATENGPNFKWGGNARYGSVDNDVKSDSYTQDIKPDGNDLFKTEKAGGTNKSYNTGANLRFEWAVDSMTQIIFTPNLQYNKNKNWQSSDFSTVDSLDWVNKGNTDYYMEGTGLALDGTIDFSRKLSNTGRVFSVSFSGGINNKESETDNISNTYYKTATPEKELNQYITNNDDSYNWRAFASYVEPIGWNNFLQLTYSYRRNHSKSDKITYDVNNNNQIDDDYSRLTKNDFTNQEIGLNFKSIRQKFNYTLGLGIQPSSMNTEISGEDAIKRSVTNFAPNAQFNYIWSRNTNLRVDYSGRTNEPSASQLTKAKDQTDPSNIVTGNPSLDPSFENRLSIRFRSFNPEQASAFMIFGRFTHTLDDIVNISTINGDGVKTTTYGNVNGNFNGNLRVIFNTPLKFNTKFSVNSMSFGSFSRRKGIIDDIVNIANTTSLQESLGADYRSDIFDAGVRGNFNYNNIKNTSRVGQTTYSYGGNFNTTIYLPYSFTVESDINYSTNSGYSSGYKQDEWLWNASLSKAIFKNKAGTLRFKIYDILQDRSNISRSSTQSSISDVMTNSINSYFMFHFVYKFQLFKGGVKQTDMEDGMRRGMGGGGRRGGMGGPPM